MLEKLYVLFRFLIYSPQIKRNLKDLEKKINELKERQAEIQDTKIMISKDYIEGVKEEHSSTINYIEHRDCFAFHTKAQQVAKNLSVENIPNNIIYLKNTYIELSNKYNDELESLIEKVKYINQALKPYYDDVESFHNEIARLRQDYFTNSSMQNINDQFENIFNFFKDTKYLNSDVEKFLKLYSNLSSLVSIWNKEYVKEQLIVNKGLFSNVDGKSLDQQQRKAVVVDEDHNLVVAGAGAGKTLTISGKVKYLVEKKGIKPEEILLVTFTKKAAGEMEERISKRLNINVVASTFHKLGMNIIGKFTNNKPDVQDEPRKIINQYFESNLYDNPEQLKRIIEYFGYYINVPKDMGEFQNLGECYDHYKQVDFETLKSKYEQDNFIDESSRRLKGYKKTLSGEKVKSLEEVMIANFLFLNGITYKYEEPYKHNTANSNRRQYKPDFYLPDFDIYIEHFGLNEENRAPWLNDYY
ncbi:hypothetical protein N780_13440 [Pontibacillus chungwhensis BH030062]|uniref:UvrD-like helicase ATP-binding domain-containing protein n=1 Tax=Pontibacillus chungwhensis BH030062 TaxID=1385513 RepID=A0A0A2UWQ2_9BACI|nr:UvrD-helicase domain-containing protein [Pontibacillus chungwhensis]KGP92727.1 hypothetical protein N780_13440 [Pontibacillus chungwhensis BH030062]